MNVRSTRNIHYGRLHENIFDACLWHWLIDDPCPMSVPLVQLLWICLAYGESMSVGHYGSVNQICFKLRTSITITPPDLTELQFDWQIKRFREYIHQLWPFEEKRSPSFPYFLFFCLKFFFSTLPGLQSIKCWRLVWQLQVKSSYTFPVEHQQCWRMRRSVFILSSYIYFLCCLQN